MITLINSFSPNMLGQGRVTLEWTPISLRDIQRGIEDEGFCSFMGQANVANIFSKMIEEEILVNRKPYYIHPNDTIMQVQYIGPYFDDDALELPEGGRFAYWKIKPIELKSTFTIKNTKILTYTYGD